MSDDEEGGACNVCGGPLRYGGRHRKCGEAVMAAEAAERNRCALIARNGCLVPPDGGSPTEEERLLCEEIERRIREVAA